MTKDQNPEQMPETIFAARLNSVDVCGGEKFQYWSEKGDAISTSYTLTSTVNQLRSERDALKKQVEELIYAGQELARVASLAKCKWYHGEKDVIYDSHDLAKLIAKSVNYFNNLKL